MDRNNFLSNRLKEVLLSGHWIANTNYKEQIESITWRQAIQRAESLNRIAALTFHINYYLAGLLNVFHGGELEISDQHSLNLPPVESESDWKNLLDEFLNNAEKFAPHIEQIPDAQFEELFVDKKYGSYLRNIEGVIEHSYYHLGQVVLIRKMIINNA